MKTILFRVLCSFYIIGCCIPMTGQDYMNIFFKNGDFRKFYMKNVTEIAVTKTDSLGIEHFDYDYQHITTLTDKYVYKLQDVDSITFTKHDEKIGEQNYVSAMSAILPIISDCESIGDAEGKLDLIKSAECVKDAWSDGHQLYVQVIDDETYFFHFNQDLERENNQREDVANQVRQLASKAEFVKARGTQLSGLILNFQNENEDRKYIIEKYLDPLMKMNDTFVVQGTNIIDWEYFPNPTLKFFQHGIYSYDIIFLLTHGSYQPYDVGGRTIYLHSICAPGARFTINVQSHNSEGPTKEDLQKYKQSLISYRDNYGASDLELRYGFVKEFRRGKMCWAVYPCITEKFFQNLSKGEFRNRNSFLFNTSCQSLKGNYNFGRVLLDKGLGVYFGYDETNWIAHRAGYHLFSNLFQGNSLEKAFNDLEDEEKNNHVTENNKNYVAHLHAISYKDKETGLNTFVFPTYTGLKNNEDAQEEFNQSEKVTIEGITAYGEQINYDLKYGFFVRVDQKVDLEDLSSSQNIEAEPIQNEPAYLYGNLLFKAPLSNLVGDHKYHYLAYTYDGLHYNYMYDPNENDYNFFVEGLHCPDNNHPHMIDLGLPSGTKWRCCNVGANSPGDYGGYFAWGEIQEKSSYTVRNYAHKTTEFPEGHIHVYVVRENGVDYYSLVLGDISGSSYDVARASLGAPWRMPTRAEIKELSEYALHHSKRDSYNGVAGVTVTGPNGNKIFFPFTGYKDANGLHDVGKSADYWSSTPNGGWQAYMLRASDNSISDTSGYLSWGTPIRPVCK